MTTYAGQRKRAEVLLTLDGVPTAATVAWTIDAPDGTAVVANTSNPSTGVYRADFTAAQEGRYWIRCAATGAVIAAAETYVDVAESVFV